MIQSIILMWKQMRRGRMICLSSHNKCVAMEGVDGTVWLNGQEIEFGMRLT